MHGTPLLGVGPGLEVSRCHLLQDTIVEREIGHQALQSHMLLFQALQPFGLIHPQPALFFLPPVVGLFRDPQLPTGLDHRKPFAQVDFDGPQLPDDLFRRIPCFVPCPPPFAGRNLHFRSGLIYRGQAKYLGGSEN